MALHKFKNIIHSIRENKRKYFFLFQSFRLQRRMRLSTAAATWKEARTRKKLKRRITKTQDDGTISLNRFHIFFCRVITLAKGRRLKDWGLEIRCRFAKTRNFCPCKSKQDTESGKMNGINTSLSKLYKRPQNFLFSKLENGSTLTLSGLGAKYFKTLYYL